VRYISHELRTPLNTAFLGLKLLSSDLKASKSPKDMERYDTLVDVNLSCTAAVDILNDLLCYEKLESGILELHKENIIVDTFLRDSLLPFSVQARESGVTVTVATSRADVTPSDTGHFRSVPLQPHDVLFADKFKMDQVIRNLVSNALKFTPQGGHVTVKASFVYDRRPDPKTVSLRDKLGLGSRKGSKTSNVRSHRNPGAVYIDDITSTALAVTPHPIRGKLVVVVTDTGAGISKENQARLFNEIVQFNPEKLQAGGGSGLGLWITQEILNLHDGSISVSSEGEGKGSTFTIEMPMTRRPVATSPSVDPRVPDNHTHSMETAQESHTLQESGSAPQSTVGEVVEVSPGRQSYTVLIVDDSRLNRKMLQKCLRADGHTCFEAEDGLEAIAMVKERVSHANGGCGRPFDAILMDFVMPNMDGPTATKEIRALGYTAPIFGVTGNGKCGRCITESESVAFDQSTRAEYFLSTTPSFSFSSSHQACPLTYSSFSAVGQTSSYSSH
jgi:two-component system, sensor histidine kinase